MYMNIRGVICYHSGNQNPYIEEEQTTQWPREKIQKDKQRSTKHTYKTKDRVTGTPPKTGGEFRCSGRVSSSCSTIDTNTDWHMVRIMCTSGVTFGLLF
jgi:hypothetical protein